jgi:peptide/nickel transport system substrate-binding protein
LVLLALLAACAAPTPAPGPGTPTVASTAGIQSPTEAGPTRTPPPTEPPPTPTPTPIELVVCQTDEPASLYLYGDDVTARLGIFEALFDGPIDTTGYARQPVILAALPSVEAGTAGVAEVVVAPGERVMDAVTGALVPLGEGVQLRQLDGSVVAYAGTEPARSVQTWAEFTLLPDLQWSDGEPLTADDSVFSYEVAASPDTPASKFLVNRTARYEALDSLRTRWTGLPGWVDTAFAEHFFTPLARHRYGAHTPAELAALPEINEAPLGWGAFLAVPGGWARGASLTLLRNPYYFRAGEGLPHLDRVTFRFGLNASQILDELAGGGCDIGSAAVDFSAQIRPIRAAVEQGTYQAHFVADSAFEHLDFGLLPAEGYRRGAGNDLFQDVRVRQAVAHCLDRQALIDQLADGLAEVPAAYVPAHHPYYAGDRLAQYPFDPARGQALLAEAGWQDADGDGIRQKGNRRLAIELSSGPPDSAFRVALGEFVQAQLRDNCGIEVSPVLYPLPELVDPWPNGVLFGRRFDLGSFPWRAGLQPPCDLYLTAAIPSDQNPGGANNTGYSNAAFDAACSAALGALDEASRRAQHIEAQALFSQDLPSLPLFFRSKIGLTAARVVGYQLDSSAASDLWNVEGLSLQEGE